MSVKPQVSWDKLLAHVRIKSGQVQYHVLKDGWGPGPTIPPDEQVNVVHQGDLEYIIGGQSFRVSREHVVFCPAGIQWSGRQCSAVTPRITVLQFQARFPGRSRLLDVLGFPYSIHPDLKTWRRISRIVQSYGEQFQKKPPGYELKQLSLLYEFFYTVFPFRGDPSGVCQEEDKVLSLINYMRRNYSDPQISLEKLGSMAHVSPSRLSNVFKQYTGKSPIQFLIEIRMEEAQRFLAIPKFTIAEVAELLGYDDPAYFTRLFRKRTGISPKEFRDHQVLVTERSRRHVGSTGSPPSDLRQTVDA